MRKFNKSKYRGSGKKSNYAVISQIYKRPGRNGGTLVMRKGYGMRNRGIGANSQSIAWGACPFPRELVTQVTYAENLTITATTGAPNNYLFSTNGLYDPNITGTGSQPRYFDTLCGGSATNAPYYNYRVSASKITVEAIPGGNDSDSISMRGFLGVGLINTTTTGPATLSEMRMRQDYKTKYLGYWGGGTDFNKIKRFTTMKSLFNVKDIKDDSTLQGDYTANPSKQGRWVVTWVPANETSTSVVRVLVKIVYYVTFFDRNDVQDS